MPYRAFGFDDAGVGFDQAPFASDLNIQIAAVGVAPAAIGVAQVQVNIPVREQVVDLGAWGSSGFTGAILIEPDLIVGRATAYLRQLDWASGTGVSLLLASTATGQPHTAGPEFIHDVEDYSLAFTFADSGGGSVVIGGPNDPDSNTLDPTEPYYWLPSNNNEWLTWYNNAANNGYDVTLTIRAVPPPEPPRLNISAFATAPASTSHYRQSKSAPFNAAPLPHSQRYLYPLALRQSESSPVQRRSIHAFDLSPESAGLSAVLVRSADREPISAITTSPISVSPAQVRVRSVERHAVAGFAGFTRLPWRWRRQ